MSNDILVHFGVKGKKLGVRKDQYNKIRNRPLKSTTVTTKYGDFSTIQSRGGTPGV